MDTYLHCHTGTSDKVYSLHVRVTRANHFAVMGFYGKRGGTLSTRGSFYIFNTSQEAHSKYKDIEKEKRNKGYTSATCQLVWPRGRNAIIKSFVGDALIMQIINKVAVVNFGPTPTTTKKANPIPKNNKASSRQAKPTPKTSQPNRSSKTSTTSTSNQLAIPPWILTCFNEISDNNRNKAAEILGDIFPLEKKLILVAARFPENKSVDWMRAVFCRLPIDQRKNIYRKISKVLHPDTGGTHDGMARWTETYKRFGG